MGEGGGGGGVNQPKHAGEGDIELFISHFTRAVAGLGLSDQKPRPSPPPSNRYSISHRKNGLLNRLPEKVSFSVFD
jgi:hypothetical protein